MHTDLAAEASKNDRPIQADPAERRRAPQPGGVIAAIGVLGVLLALVLGACSGGVAPSDDVPTLVDPSASPDASPTASLDPEAAMDAFAACMREHGVNVQISTGGDGGGNGTIGNGTSDGPRKGTGTDKSNAEMDAANKACSSLLPKGGVNGPGGAGMDAATQQKMLDFSACMRQHGINMPDPKFENGGATVQIGGPDGDGSQVDPDSQAFKDAQKACESLLPDKGAGVGSGPATQGSKP